MQKETNSYNCFFLSSSSRSSSEDPANPETLPLLLQCLLSLLTHIPDDIMGNPHFKRFVTTKLSPTLIAYLDLADNSSVTSSSAGGGMMKGSLLFKKRSRKRRSVELTEVHVKTLISVTMELSRLLGPVSDMRPILESVYHRMFICSQKKNRNVPMQMVGEVSAGEKRKKNRTKKNQFGIFFYKIQPFLGWKLSRDNKWLI